MRGEPAHKFSLALLMKPPNPSSVNGFAVATFPPQGKVSKTIIFRQNFGMRAFELPSADVKWNGRRKEHILATRRTQSQQRSEGTYSRDECQPLVPLAADHNSRYDVNRVERPFRLRSTTTRGSMRAVGGKAVRTCIGAPARSGGPCGKRTNGTAGGCLRFSANVA